MKKRQLSQLGYHVVTINHRDYSNATSNEQKCQVLLDALNRLEDDKVCS